MTNSTSRIYQDGACIGDRYIVKTQVGRGGFAQVYSVEDKQNPSTNCIVKALIANENNRYHPNIDQILGISYEREKLALRETKNLSITPNLIEYLDNKKYIVEELIEGQTVEKYLENPENKNFTIREIIEFQKSWLSKLGQFHNCGLVHRDLSPSNIILRNNNINDPVFIDLGTAKKAVNFEYYLYLLAFAKLLNDKYLRLFSFYFHTLTQQLQQINNGTPAENYDLQPDNFEYQRTQLVCNERYVAPEREQEYLINNRKLTEEDKHNYYRIDIYSLGKIFKEILKKLVLASDITITAYSFLKKKQLNGKENKLISILQKMTQYNCFDRYQLVDEVLRGIEEFEQEVADDTSNTLITFIIPEPLKPVVESGDNSGNADSNRGKNSLGSEGEQPAETKLWSKNKVLVVITGACLSLGIIGSQIFSPKPEEPPIPFVSTSICPPSFDKRVTWGGQYLLGSTETTLPNAEEAIKNLNEACTLSKDIKNQQNVEDSIPLFEAAKNNFQQAVQQQPQNGQLLASLHNTEIFLEEATKKAKDIDNYKNRAEVMAVAATIQPIGSNDEEELRNLGNSLIIGSLMYLKDLNNQSVILLIFDDQSDSRKNNNVNQEIITDLKDKIPNLLGVVGHALSSVTKVVLPFYEEEEILLITSSSTANDINPESFDIFKRVVIPNDVIAKGIFKTIQREVQLQPETKVSILYENDVYGKDLGEQVYRQFCAIYGKSCLLDENNQSLDRETQPENVTLDSIKQLNTSHKKDLENTQVLILIPNGKSRQNIVDLVDDTNQKALIISPDSAFNSFTTHVEDGSCIAEGMLVITPKFKPTFSQKVTNFIKLKNQSHQLNNQEVPDWQKLETKDWRIPHSYAASKSILWVNEEDYSDGKSISDGTYIGKIQFDDNTGSRITELDNAEKYIHEYEVTSECEFEQK